MTLTVNELNDQSAWTDFVLAQAPASFLQSWEWGEQYLQQGNQIYRLAVYDNQQIVGVALLLQVKARRGSFLLCPHGPVFLTSAAPLPILRVLVDEAIKLGQKDGCAFLRFCSTLADTATNQGYFKELGFKNAPIHMHPELAWILDLRKSEEALLSEMRKTTRYLIRKTEKEGIKVWQSTDLADLDRFWPIYSATAARQHFTPFSKAAITAEFSLMAKHNQIAFFFAEFQGELIAASIIVFYGQMAFYHHSGSVQKFERINASYLLQWRVIQEAQRRGCQFYNFWGIAPEDRPKHPWAGLSQFKKGFGGFAESYVHAQDKVLQPKYYLNYLIETARRLRRGL